MSGWTAIVVIVAIVAWAITRSARYRTYSQPREAAEQDHAAQLEREIIELRKRLEVLERIATEDGETRRLSREIESLRDSSSPSGK